MSNWKKYTLAAGVVLVAGFAYINGTHRHIPADLRDAVADDKEFNTAIPVIEKGSGNIPEPKAAAVETNTAKVKKVRSSASDFSRGDPGKGPLFERVQEGAQTKSAALRFEDKDPYAVLKQMFDTGKQPEKKDLLVGRMLAGRTFFSDHKGAKVPVFVAKRVHSDDGPLFPSSGLKVGTVFEGDVYCSLSSSGKEQCLDPAEFKDGSAVAVWKDGRDAITTSYRINSGYIVSKMEVRTASKDYTVYSYFFGTAVCVTETTTEYVTETTTGGGSGGWVHHPFNANQALNAHQHRPGIDPLIDHQHSPLWW